MFCDKNMPLVDDLLVLASRSCLWSKKEKPSLKNNMLFSCFYNRVKQKSSLVTKVKRKRSN